jgi:hypothetical protein
METTLPLSYQKDVATHQVECSNNSIKWVLTSDVNDSLKLKHINDKVKLIEEALKTLKKK